MKIAFLQAAVPLLAATLGFTAAQHDEPGE